MSTGIALGWLAACGPADSRHADEATTAPVPPAVPVSRAGRDRVGAPAPEWGDLRWLNSEPLRLADLRGRVVLVRFWTDTCPFCRASAPALARLHADYGARGVTVVAIHHPKPRGARRSDAEIAEAVERFGWELPVALDPDWSVLDDYWLDDARRDYTSVSFVIDARGVIRYVHGGPEFHPGGPDSHEECRRDYAEIRQALDALLQDADR